MTHVPAILFGCFFYFYSMPLPFSLYVFEGKSSKKKPCLICIINVGWVKSGEGARKGTLCPHMNYTPVNFFRLPDSLWLPIFFLVLKPSNQPLGALKSEIFNSLAILSADCTIISLGIGKFLALRCLICLTRRASKSLCFPALKLNFSSKKLSRFRHLDLSLYILDIVGCWLYKIVKVLFDCVFSFQFFPEFLFFVSM